MEIFTYQAECGDATRIRFIGNDGLAHNVFIDAGFERTFRGVLQSDLKEIKDKNEGIDVWIVSHIHDDHIGGIIAYIKAIKDGEEIDIVKNWFYNPPRHFIETVTAKASNQISTAKSIRQGDDLLSYLAAYKRKYTSEICSDLPALDLHGLVITFLSPNKNALAELREKHKTAKVINYEELTLISEAKSATGFDYKKLLIDFDLNEWEEDDSVENKSSISVLMEFHEKKILWLADSHPSIIIESLKKSGYSETNPLVCELVQVSHHGSKANNSVDMYKLIKCNNYILSVNGENRSFLPTKECIARILRNPSRPKGSHYKLFFTYDNATLRKIFNSDGNDVFEKFDFSVRYQNDKKALLI